MPQNRQNPNILDTLSTMFSAFDLSKEERRLINHIDILLRKHDIKRVMLIGGVVRDLFLNSLRKSNSRIDIDLIVEGDVLSAKSKIIEVYPEGDWIDQQVLHTMRGTLQNISIDIASARLERYQYAGAFPTIDDLTTIEYDEYRRDFTLNALRIPLPIPIEGDLKGLIQGSQQALNDISSKTLRIYHNNSFSDDPLRVIRAARYSARLGLSIDQYTLEQIPSAASGLKNISNNRIRNELELLFSEKNLFWQKATSKLIEWQFFKMLPCPLTFNINAEEAEKRLIDLDQRIIQSEMFENAKQIEPWQRKLLMTLSLALHDDTIADIADFMKWLGGCGNIIHDLESINKKNWRVLVNQHNMTKLVLYFYLLHSSNENDELNKFMASGYNAVPMVKYQDFEDKFIETHDFRKIIQDLWIVKFTQPELGIKTKTEEIAWILENYKKEN